MRSKKKIQLFCNICQVQAISHNLSWHLLFQNKLFWQIVCRWASVCSVLVIYQVYIFWCIGLQEASLHFFRSIVNWWFSCLAVRPTSIWVNFIYLLIVSSPQIIITFCPDKGSVKPGAWGITKLFATLDYLAAEILHEMVV